MDKVRFMGEHIVDVYHYGRLLGRTMKEPILNLEVKWQQSFDGGVIAAANHARDFCELVDVESYIKVWKERYIEELHLRKLFEVSANPQYWPVYAERNFGFYDRVVVCDYGHGMFTLDLIGKIVDGAKYLAVNVQTNSANYGFNLATKWPRCDYLCMDETEARLATGNQHGNLQASMEELSLIAPTVVVTIGANGALGWSSKGKQVVASAPFPMTAVDTMGAGDAFFAVSALYAGKVPLEKLLRIGNAAGAAKTQIVGHQRAVTKLEVEKILNENL